VLNCTVKGGQYGIDAYAGTRVRVIGNHVEGVTKSSYWIDNCQGSILSGNTATGATGHCRSTRTWTST